MNKILNDNEIFYLTDNVFNQIEVLENTNVTIIEKNIGNFDIEINIGKNSNVVYETINSKNINRCFHLDESSNLSITSITTQETVDRTNVFLNNKMANVSIKNLAISDCNIIYNTFINHLAKDSKSDVLNVGVSLDNGNVVYNTTGKIEKGNSKSECIQLSKGIIIGNNSKVVAKPVLLIDEYDVFAKHGAAIGKMSDDELFYLMSRGLNKQEAFSLILMGLLNPIVESLSDKLLIEEVFSNIDKMIG